VKLEEVWSIYRREHLGGTIAQRRADVAWKQMEPMFGKLPVSLLSPSAIEAYRRSRAVSNSTIRRELVLLVAALHWSQRTGRLKSVPMIPLPAESSPRVRFLTQEELNRLVRAADNHSLGVFVRLAILTGQRKSALLELTWDRVDLRERVIRFADAQDSLQARRKGRGAVPLTPALETLLRGSQGPGNRILDSTGFRNRWEAAVEEAGLPGVTPHVLRHTTATLLCQKGVPLLEISRLLGHRDSRTTERVYVTFTPGYLSNAMSQMEGVLA
jgi:integrase